MALILDDSAEYLRLPQIFTTDCMSVILSVRAYSTVRTFVHVMPLQFQLRNHWRINQAEYLDGCCMVRLTSTDYRYTFWCSWLQVRACFESAE